MTCTCETYGNCVPCNEARQCKHEQIEMLVSERMAYDVTNGVIDWDSGFFVSGGIDPVFTCLECSEDLHPITVDGIHSTSQINS